MSSSRNLHCLYLPCAFFKLTPCCWPLEWHPRCVVSTQYGVAKEVLSLLEMADARVITFSFTALVLQLVALHIISPKSWKYWKWDLCHVENEDLSYDVWVKSQMPQSSLCKGICCTSHGPKRFSWLLQDACLDNGFWKIGQVDTDFWTGRLQPEYIGDLNQWDTTEVVDDRNTFPMFPFLCLGLFLFWKPGNMKFFTNLPTPSLVKCPSLQVLRPTNSFLTSQLCISNFTTYVACCDLGKYYSNPGSSLALGWLTTRNMLHTAWRCFLNHLCCRILFGKALE